MARALSASCAPLQASAPARPSRPDERHRGDELAVGGSKKGNVLHVATTTNNDQKPLWMNVSTIPAGGKRFRMLQDWLLRLQIHSQTLYRIYRAYIELWRIPVAGGTLSDTGLAAGASSRATPRLRTSMMMLVAFYIYLSIYISLSLSRSLSLCFCLPACLPVRRPVGLSDCMFACLLLFSRVTSHLRICNQTALRGLSAVSRLKT